MSIQYTVPGFKPTTFGMWPRYKERSIKASAERKVDRTGLQWLYDCLLTCGNEIYSRPLEDTDFVVVVDAE